MKFFPMFLRMVDRSVLIIGGGEQAAQKARLMLKTQAELILCAPELDDELADLVGSGRARHVPSGPDDALLTGHALVLIATGDAELDAALAVRARALGVLINVVDRPDLCDANTPSIVDRDPLVVAIGTEGTAPVLARQIKTQIEFLLEPQLGELAALSGRLRGAVAAGIARPQRRGFWDWVFGGAPRALFARGAGREAAETIKAAIAAGGAPDRGSLGRLTWLDGCDGARDLMSMRAVQRLQEADLIIHDPLSDPLMLELARRDCDRLHVMPSPEGRDLAAQSMRAALGQGLNVVRMVAGDVAAARAGFDGNTAAHEVIKAAVSGWPKSLS